MVLNVYLNSYKIHKMRINSSEYTIPFRSINKKKLFYNVKKTVLWIKEKQINKLSNAQLIKFP